MSTGLVQTLLDKGYASKVDEESQEKFLKQHAHSLLFFAGDVGRFPESNDLAIILPELSKAFDGQFQIGLVSDSVERSWQQHYGVNHFPTLVMLRGDKYLGAISKLQDWANYCVGIQRLLQSDPVRPPGFTIPVVVNN